MSDEEIGKVIRALPEKLRDLRHGSVTVYITHGKFVRTEKTESEYAPEVQGTVSRSKNSSA